MRRVTERPEVVVLYLPLMAIPMSLPFIASNWVAPTWLEGLILLGIASATQMAQWFMTRGLQAEKTGRATTVGYVQILFAGVWGAMFFGERITWWTVSGAAVMLSGLVALVLLHHTNVGIDE